MKKVLSLVLVLTLVLGSFSLAFAAPSDVVDTEYEAAVERLGQLGIFTGYTDGTFKPANTITRSEFAAVVVRAKGLEAAALAAKGQTAFADVPAENWSSGYVNIASKMGFVKGYPNGNFGLNDPVTYEQAITMVIRALGYEPAAEARGGYPYGNLIVANEIGLLDAVKGTQGLPAPRGLVAQLVDNALEIPLMIQVGYGAQTKWVVSGTEDTKEAFLLDELGFDSVEGRIVDFDSAKSRITLSIVDAKNKTLNVADDFDFNYFEGLNVKTWFNASTNKVVFCNPLEEAKYDATNGAEKITLVRENKKYVVAKNADLLLNGEEKDAEDFTADYAKIVLNDDGEILWAKGYTLDGFIVLEEVKEEIAYGYDGDEIDLEDFTVLKDGKTITLEDLEESDILFFNKAEEVAVVYNNSKTGELERVYTSTDEFKFEGKVYSVIEDAKYLDGEDSGSLTTDVLDEMLAEEEDIEVFFNTRNVPVLVVGSRGIAATNSFYGRVTAEHQSYTGRSGLMHALDVRNEEGKIVSYDLKDSFVTDNDKFINGSGNAHWSTDDLVRITVDTDGVPTKVENLALRTLDNDFKISATYARAGGTDYRLKSNTLVFEGKKVTKLEDAEGAFSVVKAGSEIYVQNGRVEAVVGTTDADDDTTTYVGLVKKIRTLTSGAKELTLEVYGETKVFLTGTAATDTAYVNNVNVGDIATVEVGNKTEKIANTVTVDAGVTITVSSRSTSNKTIVDTVYGTYELNSKAVVYNKDASTGKFTTISLRDLVAQDTVKLYRDASSDRFVNYVVRIAEAPEGNGEGTIVGKTVEAINATSITVEGVQYPTTIDYSSSITVGDKITYDLVEGLYGQMTMINVQKVTE